MNPLEGLRDIQLPAPPGWWPPAPGWWLLALLVVAALALAWRPLRAWQRRRRLRRRLRDTLETLRTRAAHASERQAVLAELSTLLRRVALARHPREQVAGLVGDAWLRFLDETGGAGGFSNGPGRVLVRAPYKPVDDSDAAEVTALLDTARRWLVHNA